MGKKLTTEEFIAKAKAVHGDKYDYSDTIYTLSRNNINIHCKKHNHTFIKTANNHLMGQGCPLCSTELDIIRMSKTTEEFISDAKRVHGDKYNYSKTKYINAYTHVTIICPIHGEFNQTPSTHIYSMSGCAKCRISHKVREICEILTHMNIEYFMEYTFPNCKHKLLLPFDFYIPSLNLCIEYDGEQHFKPFRFYKDSQKNLDKLYIIQHRDKIKTQYCKDNNIGLLRISYLDTDIKYILNNEVHSTAGSACAKAL